MVLLTQNNAGVWAVASLRSVAAQAGGLLGGVALASRSGGGLFGREALTAFSYFIARPAKAARGQFLRKPFWPPKRA